jgi:type IV pilus assembly protein PilX
MLRLTASHFGLASARRQTGLSLIFALMALAALSVAAVALIRSVDTGSLVVGNVALKQDTLVTADRVTEQAINWLGPKAVTAAVHNDDADEGYYATTLDGLDVTGQSSASAARAVVDWEGDGCSTYPAGSFGVCKPAHPEVTLTGGNKARWIVMRLCSAAGAPATAGVDCASTLNSITAEGTMKGGVDYNTDRFDDSAYAQYYRIVVRAQGARGTVSYTDTVVHF